MISLRRLSRETNVTFEAEQAGLSESPTKLLDPGEIPPGDPLETVLISLGGPADLQPTRPDEAIGLYDDKAAARLG
jgi:hypothetical protein